jgi:uncharacterized protein (TIGR02453 family)
MNSKLILTFLEELSKNNNREWFHANKFRYEEAKNEFEKFIDQIILFISKFDKDIKNISAKDCLFRIYNDIRFAKNRPLYKTNFGGSIAKGGKNGGHAGYYFHLEKNNCFLGGGIYMPPADNLKLIRKEIYYNHEEFSKIINAKSFKKYFHELDDIKLSRVPKEFPKDFIGAELLKYKSYTMIYPLQQKLISSNELDKTTTEVFKVMLPLNNFLNKAIFNPK